MPKRKRAPDEPGAQSQRFVEAAKLAGATKSTAKFERVFRKVAPAKRKNR
jgi:hypothetical protein